MHTIIKIETAIKYKKLKPLRYGNYIIFHDRTSSIMKYKKLKKI